MVGVHEASPQVLWTKAFLQNQGFEVNKATLYQYNMSAMLLENNGPASSSSRTKHIEIRYFLNSGSDRKGRHRVRILPYRQDSGGFHDKAAPREIFFEFRYFIMGISNYENIAKVRKVRGEIAQKEDLQNG